MTTLQLTPERPPAEAAHAPEGNAGGDEGDILRRAELTRLERYEIERAADEGMTEPDPDQPVATPATDGENG
jgi:hypothetical protein